MTKPCLLPESMAFLLAGLVWLAFEFHGPGVPPAHSDTWDYAQLGRNNARGHFFDSDFTYPLALRWDPSPPFHTLWRLPLYPLACSIPYLFSAAPPIQVYCYLSGFFFCLAAALYARLAIKTLASRLLPLALFLFVLSPHLLSPSLVGLSEPFYISLVLAVVLCLLSDRAWLDAFAGLLLGLAWLTRSNVLFLLPALASWLLAGSGPLRKRFFRTCVFMLVMAMVCIPWWLRNAILTGSPFFNLSSYLPLMFTEEWPGWSLFRTVIPPGRDMPELEMSAFVDRGIHCLWTFGVVQRLISCNPVVWLAFLLGMISALKQRKSDPRSWRLCLFIVSGDIVTTGSLCFIHPDMRVYSPMLPLVYLQACHGTGRMLEDASLRARRGQLACLLTLALVVSSAAYSIRFWSNQPRESWPTLSAGEIAQLKRDLPPGGVVASDLADYLAWSLDRPVLELPKVASFQDLQSRGVGVEIIHLSPLLGELVQSEGKAETQWLDVFRGSPLAGAGDLLFTTPSGHRFYSARSPG
jgi:hypothetical protein